MKIPNYPTHDYYPYWKPVENGETEPDEYQAALMQIVQTATEAGVFYNTDMRAYVKEHADFIPAEAWDLQYQPPKHQVEGGILGMEIYSARCALRDKKIRTDNSEAAANLSVGQVLGSMIVNGKIVHKCVIESIDGCRVGIRASIGKYGCTLETEARYIEGMKQRYQQRKGR